MKGTLLHFQSSASRRGRLSSGYLSSSSERWDSGQVALPLHLLYLCKTRGEVYQVLQEVLETGSFRGTAPPQAPPPRLVPPSSAQHSALLPTLFTASEPQSHPATRLCFCHPTAQPRAPHGSLALFPSCQEKPASFQAIFNLEIVPRACTAPQK